MPDFGFVGAAYTAPSITQDAQECINWRPEVDPTKAQGERGVTALYPTPGLTLLTTFPNQEAVRGLRTISSGGSQLIAVCGSYVYALSYNFQPSIIGQLLTTTGPVSITDNGVYVYIVDGNNRYSWYIDYPDTTSFVGSITGTNLNITSNIYGSIAVGQQVFGIGVLPQTIITAGSGNAWTVNQSQVVASQTLDSDPANSIFTASIAYTGSGSTLVSTMTVTAVARGAIHVGETIQGAGIALGTIVTALGTGTGGVGTYILSPVAQTISSETMYSLQWSVLPASDGAFQGGGVVDVNDNYFIYTRPNSQQFAVSDLLSPITQPLSFASKFTSPDNLVSLIADNGQLYLLGEKSSEVWVDQGTFPFAYQRIPGSSNQQGIIAPYSVARVGNYFCYVSQNIRGQNQIVLMNGYIPQRVSTHAVEQTLLDQYTNDAIAYTYQLEGHEVYVVTFPTIDITWAYDLTTNLWHKWLWTDSDNNYHRHRSNCAAVFQGIIVVGDWENGNLYQLNQAEYTDAGSEIRRLRRAPHLVADLQRQYFDELQIQFQPGVGTGGFSRDRNIYIGSPYTIPLSTPLTIGVQDIYVLGNSGQIAASDIQYNPKAMLRWSNDGGSTWSKEYWQDIGQQGKYTHRAIWRRLGMARDRIFEVVVTDPIKAVIVSANLKGSQGDN
jgi:hypothetical protein